MDMMELLKSAPGITVAVPLDDLRELFREIAAGADTPSRQAAKKRPDTCRDAGSADAHGDIRAEEYLTRGETARLLGVTLATLHNWKRSGCLLPEKIGHKVYYRRSEIRRALSER